jgi:hypothetical protein
MITPSGQSLTGVRIKKPSTRKEYATRPADDAIVYQQSTHRVDPRIEMGDRGQFEEAGTVSGIQQDRNPFDARFAGCCDEALDATLLVSPNIACLKRFDIPNNGVRCQPPHACAGLDAIHLHR